jgi:hypothetical protein
MRELLIVKLQKQIRTLSSVLIKEYDARLLAKFLELEKEVQIQQSYLSQED